MNKGARALADIHVEEREENPAENPPPLVGDRLYRYRPLRPLRSFSSRVTLFCGTIVSSTRPRVCMNLRSSLLGILPKRRVNLVLIRARDFNEGWRKVREEGKCVSTLRTKTPAGRRDESFPVSCVARFRSISVVSRLCSYFPHFLPLSSLCHSCFASRSRLCTFARIISGKRMKTHWITEQSSCYVAGIARMRATPRRNAPTVHSIARSERKRFLRMRICNWTLLLKM